MGMTYFYTTILREKRGYEGLVNFQHTHILETNDAGLLTKVEFHSFNKIPVKGNEWKELWHRGLA